MTATAEPIEASPERVDLVLIRPGVDAVAAMPELALRHRDSGSLRLRFFAPARVAANHRAPPPQHTGNV